MKILITGVAGFVGSFLSNYLLDNTSLKADLLKAKKRVNRSVELPFKQLKNIQLFGTLIDNSEIENIWHIKNRLNIFKCDIQDASRVAVVISKIKPDWVYHLAALSSAAEEDRHKVFSVNVWGTKNILRSCAKLKKKVRVLLPSTGYVYGSGDFKKPFSEESPVTPIGVYAESKFAMEKEAKEFFGSNLEIIIIRAFNHTGPKQSPGFVVPAIACQIAEIEQRKKEPVVYVGNLDAIRDFTDVRDVVRAYVLALIMCKPYEIYNIASGKGFSIREIVFKLLTLSKKKIKIKQDIQRQRTSEIPVSIGNFKKFHQATSWRPEISLDKTLEDTLEYWRNRLDTIPKKH